MQISGRDAPLCINRRMCFSYDIMSEFHVVDLNDVVKLGYSLGLHLIVGRY